MSAAVEARAVEVADAISIDLHPDDAAVAISERISEEGDLGEAIYMRACDLYVERCAERADAEVES